jgi:muramoyltetrapeptide carboxypeptidase
LLKPAKLTNSLYMRTPPRLQKGDLIALASPARHISKEELMPAVEIIKARGYRVQLDQDALAIHNQFAGTDRDRTEHFQKLIDTSDLKAIICTRGGYGSLRMIDKLDFSAFRRRPKWVVGYSDITVFHTHLLHYGFESIHGSMPINFAKNTPEALQSLFDCLEGKRPTYRAGKHPLNRCGTAEGTLMGGNLSILYSLVGSYSFPKTKGNILFIEDLDEYLYHIDRMMLSLKRAEVFDGLGGLIVGGMTGMNDNKVPYGKTAEEIIREQLSGFDFPICFGFPAGHIDDNRALVMGGRVSLNVDAEGSVLLST